MKHKKLMITLMVFLSLVFIWVIMIVFPTGKVLGKDSTNPFLKTSELPIIAAHRGGRYMSPENTIAAFNNFNRLYIATNRSDEKRMLETDLRMTKDQTLVLMHDSSVDRTSDIDLVISDFPDEMKGVVKSSNGKYEVSSLTLDQLNHLNFAYKFQDSEGKTPYSANLDNKTWEERGKLLSTNGQYYTYSICSLDEFFNQYHSYSQIIYSVEIKDSDELGKKAVDQLVKKMKEYEVTDRVVVGTFHDEISSYLEENYPNVMMGASTGVAAKFLVTTLLGVNVFMKPKFCCLQIPTSYGGINITLQSLYNRAHKRGISVQIWTINEVEDMKKLIKMDVDVIMTDKPDVLFNLYETDY